MSPQKKATENAIIHAAALFARLDRIRAPASPHPKPEQVGVCSVYDYRFLKGVRFADILIGLFRMCQRAKCDFYYIATIYCHFARNMDIGAVS